MDTINVDFVIIGSGLSGSAAAYGLSRIGDVALLSKSPVVGTNSYAAQGGIAAATMLPDTPESHYSDTLNAGAELCQSTAVSLLVHRAPEVIKWLIELGVPFDRDSVGNLSIGLEGAHSHPRILHAGGDATGRHVMAALTDKLSMCPTVELFDAVQVTSLVKDNRGRVVGALGLCTSDPSKKTLWMAKKAVILATGGAGQLFSHSSNPTGATGDGIALAFAAGAKVSNMEFVQFHPTVLLEVNQPSLLISEAVRGAGARLIDERGIPVMDQPSQDLAARDIVARAIYRHNLEQGQVYLDTTLISEFPERFPTIYERCLVYGINPTETPIPVSPAAHFLMGGVAATMSGQTSLSGLYAIGETANTGVHGANRLASNSLLECLVTAFELTEYLTMIAPFSTDQALFEIGDARELRPDTEETLAQVQEILWESCGIIRNEQGLRTGLDRLAQLRSVVPDSPSISTATLIAVSALTRHESRGAHYRSDYPETDASQDHATILSKDNFSTSNFI